MLSQRFVVPGLIAVVALSASLGFAASGISLEGVKCLMVAKNDAKKDKAAKWKEGEVFFCCGNCQGKFEKASKEEKSKLAAKANHQLVATKQYEQEGCPFSGGQVDDSTLIKVGAAEIGFCCKNCKAKAEKMKDDEQISKLFGEKAFKTAKFQPAKHDK